MMIARFHVYVFLGIAINYCFSRKNIDPDTPLSQITVVRYRDGVPYELVMSDEFNSNDHVGYQ